VPDDCAGTAVQEILFGTLSSPGWPPPRTCDSRSMQRRYTVTLGGGVKW
jgi:hypothetical protein